MRLAEELAGPGQPELDRLGTEVWEAPEFLPGRQERGGSNSPRRIFTDAVVRAAALLADLGFPESAGSWRGRAELRLQTPARAAAAAARLLARAERAAPATAS